MIFNSYYCRLCYCFRMAGSQISRYLTTFDAAIYSIIYSRAAGLARPPHLHCEKFGKKNLEHFQNDGVGKIFVDASYIAIGEKVRDDKVDGDRVRALATNLLFGKQIERASREHQKAREILQKGFDQLNQLQQENRDPMSLFVFYGDVSVQMFQALFPKPVEEKYLDLFRAILKWTFFMDMVCDYEDDRKKGAFNSFRDEECATFSQYFDKHYMQVFSLNTQIGNEVMNALLAVYDDSREWRILYRILTHSLNNVMQDKIAGKDPRFKMVSETAKNWRDYLKRLPEQEG